MKAVICYFSGTGNTKKVVDCCSDSLKNFGIDVLVHNIDSGANIDLKDVDMLGIAYPIHAFNAPSIVVDFAKKLKKQEKKTKLFIVKTSGEPLALNNISSCKLKAILKKKNFVLTNEYHYVMPYNMIFRHSDSMAYHMWNVASQIIPLDCHDIVDGKSVKLRYVPFGRFMSWIFRIEHWGGRFNGKRYKVNENCVHCQMCVKRCPTHNITIENGEFHFGNKCLMCVRCSFNCPKNAIKIGWFDKWKVNGAYNFNNPDGTEQKSHRNYCKNSYKKYFERNEKRIALYKEKADDLT